MALDSWVANPVVVMLMLVRLRSEVGLKPVMSKFFVAFFAMLVVCLSQSLMEALEIGWSATPNASSCSTREFICTL